MRATVTRLRPDPDRAGPLRGRRPHRHLRDAGARERGADVLIISADKDLMQLVGPGVAMFDPASGDREERRIGPAEVVDYFGARRRQGRRHPGARRRFDRQRAGRAGHRRQDGGAADRRIRRPRHAARARRRDQAAEAARDADQPGERRAHPPVEAAGDAGHATSRSTRRSTRSACPKLEAEPLIAFLKAMEFTTITKRVADLAGLDAECDRARPALRRPRRLARPQWRASGAGSRGFARRAAPPPRRRRAAPAAATAPTRTPQTLAAARAAEARADAVRRRRLPDRQRRRDAAGLDRPRRRGGRRRLRHRDDLARSACRRNWSAFRSPSAPGEACYIPIGHSAGEAGLFERRRPAARPDRRSRSDRAAEAAARRPRRAEDRPERQIRLARLRPARHRGRAVRRHDADLLRARFRRDQRRPRHGRACPSAGSATRRSRSPKSPARDAISSASPACRSTRRPHTPPRTPT